MKKILFMAICFLCMHGVGYAQEIAEHLTKTNAIAFKFGCHFYEHSDDFMDFWGIDENDMRGFAFEIAYEKKMARNFSIELALGHFNSSVTYGNISTIAINNTYLSPSLKYHIQISDTANIYVGAGPDLYYTDGDYIYTGPPLSYGIGENAFSPGGHGLVGIEWYVLKNPKEYDFYDAPMSIFFEYKYSYVEVDDVDKATLNNHDLNVGGHMTFLGLRWHF